MNRWFLLGLLLVAAGALALRLPQLDRRPMHTDESVHAEKFKGLWEKGIYHYDPNEYHGPSLYYATLPLARLSSARSFADLTEKNLRLVPVLFGVAAILLLWLLRDALGLQASVCAALFIAISPAMVFYSRYYIHEMMLVFFTLLVLGAGWRYAQSKHLGWALLAGAGIGLMHATKETFVFTLAAMAGGIICTLAWSRWINREPIDIKPFLRTSHWLGGLTVAVIVSCILFSSFLTHPRGPLDSLLTYVPWLGRAGGKTQHVHPWYYYFNLLAFFRHGKGLIWSEGLILILAVAGVITAFTRQCLANVNISWLRFLSFYTIFLTLVYCAIPYKTPWCLLGFYHGMILLAGVGAISLVQLCRPVYLKISVVLLLLAATGQLFWQSYRTNFVYEVDQRNPYIYAHTGPDLLNLTAKVEAISKAYPQTHQMVIQVMATGGDYWPLPWYLRRFSNVGCYAQVPDDVRAPVIIASPGMEAVLEKKLAETHLMTGFFGLRPSVFLELFVEKGLWKRYLATKSASDD